MSARLLRSRRALAAAVALVALVACAGVYALFTAGATPGSNGRAAAAALSPGSIPTAVAAGRDVTVTWAQATPTFLGAPLGSASGGGYLLTRYAESAPSTPITPAAGCAGLRQGASDPLSCTELALPTGRWRYTVTPALQLWRGTAGLQSASATVAPAAPGAPSLTNGVGAGSAFIAPANVASLTFSVSLPATSLATDTVTLTLADAGAVHTVTASKAATAGAGTVQFTGVNASTLSDGTVTVTARSKSTYGDSSADSSAGTPVKDTGGPVNSLSVTGSSPGGSAFLAGTRVYYRGTGGGAGGSFRIRNALSDPSSGPASSATAALGGTTTGWTHTASTVSTPTGGPYDSNTFTWTEGTSSSPTEVVTGRDAAGNATAASTLTLTNDSTAPTGGALTVNGTAASTGGTTSTNATGSFAISVRTDYGETQGATASGLATSTLTRQAAPLTSTDGVAAGTCGTYGSATTLVGLPAQDAGAGIAGGNCYRYTLTGTDNVGNALSVSTVVRVDTSQPTPPALVLGGTGTKQYIDAGTTTFFYNPQSTNTGSFTVTATATDTDTGVAQVAFPALTGMTGGGNDSATPFQTTYNWTSTSSATGAQTVTATNGTGLTRGSTFTVTPDTAAPTGGVVTVGGVSSSAGGATVYDADGSFGLARTDFADAGAGLASSVLTRQAATLTSSGLPDGTCGTYGSAITIPGAPTQDAAAGIATGNCYRYTLTGTDKVGNVATVVLTVKVDTTAPTVPAPTLSAATGNTYVSGTTAFVNNQAGKSGGFTVADAPTDTQSGIQKVSFPAFGTSGGGDDAASPYQATYAWSGATSGTGANTVTVTNNAGVTGTTSFTVTGDTTNPTAALTFPVDAAPYNTAGWNAGCTSAICGSAADTGSGLARVEVSVQRSSSGLYWNGSSFASATAVYTAATGTTAWTLSFPASRFPADGAYVVAARAVDNVGNTGATATATVTYDNAAPTLSSLQMFDVDGDGRVDQVQAAFSEPLAAYTAGTTPWTLGSIPSAGSLASVAVAGSTATLTFTEGTGAQDTSVGAFTVRLRANAAGIRDAAGNQSVFAAQAPVDKAAPVLVSSTSTAGTTANRMQSTNTIDLVFSEALASASVPTSSTVAETRTTTSTFTMPGIIQAATIANGYLAADNSSATATGTVTLINSSKTIHVVLGTVNTTGSGVATGSGGATLKPVATITDAAGNTAVTTSSALCSPLF